ncbi:MAG: hypothetical protein L6Q33_02620 [Bacteriovoracaceae bacterium]|nr:hypothetical protein [Bacteriovoracaceae bacterium]
MEKMERLIQHLEKTIESITRSEFRKNPKAMAMAFRIKGKINELKKVKNEKTRYLENQGVLKYLHPKSLLEN